MDVGIGPTYTKESTMNTQKIVTEDGERVGVYSANIPKIALDDRIVIAKADCVDGKVAVAGTLKRYVKVGGFRDIDGAQAYESVALLEVPIVADQLPLEHVIIAGIRIASYAADNGAGVEKLDLTDLLSPKARIGGGGAPRVPSEYKAAAASLRARKVKALKKTGATAEAIRQACAGYTAAKVQAAYLDTTHKAHTPIVALVDAIVAAQIKVEDVVL